MILGINNHGALHVFTSTEDAQRELEAIDVQEDVFEFCDDRGQRYTPVYNPLPKRRMLGPIGIVKVGRFSLVAEGDMDSSLPARFIGRAHHIEHTSLPSISTLDALRSELRKTA